MSPETACHTRKKEGIPLIGEMAGHPAMEDFIAQGYEVITF